MDALDANARAARQRPNPALDIQVEDLGSSGGFSSATGGQTTILFVQTLERGGKRAARAQLAYAALEMERIRVLVLRQQVLSAARNAFLAALDAQGRLDLRADELQQLEQFHAAISERVAAGQAAGVDRQQLGLLLARARLEHEAAVHRDRAIKSQLALLWDGHVRFEQLIGGWPAPSAPPALSDLQRLWEGSVGQRLVARELAISDADVAAAASERRQDWDVTAGFRKREQTDDWTAVVGVSLPLPIFDNGRQALEAARARRRQAHYRSETKRRDAQHELADLHGRLSTSFGVLNALDQGALTGAGRLHESVLDGYREGHFELLQVLEAQSSYFDLLERHQDALKEHHLAWAELEALMGQPLPTRDWTE